MPRPLREPALDRRSGRAGARRPRTARALRQLAEHGARAQPTLARRQRQLAEQRLQQRRLAHAVAAEHASRSPWRSSRSTGPTRKPFARRPPPRAARPRRRRAAAGREREPQLPRRPRLLDLLEPAELLGGGLLHVLRLLLLAPLAVAALLPLPHPARLLFEPFPLGGVACVRRLVPLRAASRWAANSLQPPGVDPNAARLGLELDDARHQLEEGAVVRDGDDAAAVRGEESLQ